MANIMALPVRYNEQAINCIVDKRTSSLLGEVLGADTTGSAVARVGTHAYNHFWFVLGFSPSLGYSSALE